MILEEARAMSKFSTDNRDKPNGAYDPIDKDGLPQPHQVKDRTTPHEYSVPRLSPLLLCVAKDGLRSQLCALRSAASNLFRCFSARDPLLMLFFLSAAGAHGFALLAGMPARLCVMPHCRLSDRKFLFVSDVNLLCCFPCAPDRSADRRLPRTGPPSRSGA